MLRANTSRSRQNSRMASLELREADLLAHLLEPLHPPPPLTRPDNAKRLVPGAGTRRWPRGTTPLAGRSRRPTAHGRHHGLPLSRAGPGCAYCGAASRGPGSGSGSGMMFAEGLAPGSHRPRLASARRSPLRVPVVASGRHATPRHGEHHGTCRPAIRSHGGRGRGPTAWSSASARRPRQARPPRRPPAHWLQALGVPRTRVRCAPAPVRARRRSTSRDSRSRIWTADCGAG